MDIAALDRLDSPRIRRARKRLRRLARRAPRQVATMAREQGRVAAEFSADQIRSRPLAAAAAALGVGVALGAVLAGAFRR